MRARTHTRVRMRARTHTRACASAFAFVPRRLCRALRGTSSCLASKGNGTGPPQPTRSNSTHTTSALRASVSTVHPQSARLCGRGRSRRSGVGTGRVRRRARQSERLAAIFFTATQCNARAFRMRRFETQRATQLGVACAPPAQSARAAQGGGGRLILPRT